jgi:hypothetical protein
MKNLSRRFLMLVGLVVLLVLAASTTILAQQGETVYLTTPTAGQTVSGLVTVTGAVDFADFQKYELFLKTGEQLVWAATVYAPVINGDLAFLDTRTFPDGAYQLVVRMVRNTSNYTEFMGPTFYIENNLGAPLPYPEIDSSPLYPPVSGAVARIRNCSGHTLEFDYHSPTGFCSGGNLSVMFKDQNSPVCPYQDVLLVPCEYRGTATGQGELRGAGYSFVAEAGKIYELNYPGGDVIYIAEVEGDERAATDLGGLVPGDPARQQPVPAAVTETTAAMEQSPPPADVSTSAPAVAAPIAPARVDTMLPESGQASRPQTAFVIAAAGLILLLIVGGVVAARRRGYPA